MRSPLYFLPGITSASAAQVATVGLTDRLPSYSTRQVARGPGGESGVLVAYQAPGHTPDVRYLADTQTWQPAPVIDGGKPPYWLGWTTDAPPGPEDLARDQQLDGRRVALLDGQQWLVPQLREWREGDADRFPIEYRCRVPRRYALGPTGNLTEGEVLPSYLSIWEASKAEGDSILTQLLSDRRVLIRLDDQARFCAQLLGINYRVTLVELTALGLLHEATAAAVYSAGLDLDGMRSCLGNATRRHSGGTDTCSGDAPSTPAISTPTVQPSAS